MPELNLAQTLCLAGGLVISLVLPLMMGAIPLQNAAQKKSCLKTVWSGQLCLTSAGLVILTWPTTFIYAGCFAVVSCGYYAFLLNQKLRKTI